MTLASAPWALDGARIPSSLARLESYITSGSVEGVVGQSDLKVRPLATPGVGVVVGDGGAIMLNRYLTNPNQSYAIYNNGDEQVDGGDMPPVYATDVSHLVCVTIGDPEFNPQTGHPWMTSTPIPVEQRETFQYVRFFIIPNVPSTTTSFKQYAAANGLHYPAYAIARLDIPANQTTIQDTYIKDLRKLARPRSSEVILQGGGGSNSLNTVSPAWESWGLGTQSIDVPDWATTAKVTGYFESAVISKACSGNIRVTFASGGATNVTPFNRSAPTSGSDRSGMNFGGTIIVPTAYRGTTQQIRTEGQVNSSASSGGFSQDIYTSVMVRVRFEEATL